MSRHKELVGYWGYKHLVQAFCVKNVLRVFLGGSTPSSRTLADDIALSGGLGEGMPSSIVLLHPTVSHSGAALRSLFTKYPTQD